jgi:hypothetical protein
VNQTWEHGHGPFVANVLDPLRLELKDKGDLNGAQVSVGFVEELPGPVAQEMREIIDDVTGHQTKVLAEYSSKVAKHSLHKTSIPGLYYDHVTPMTADRSDRMAQNIKDENPSVFYGRDKAAEIFTDFEFED